MERLIVIANIDDFIEESFFLGFEEIKGLIDHKTLGIGAKYGSRFAKEGEE